MSKNNKSQRLPNEGKGGDSKVLFIIGLAIIVLLLVVIIILLLKKDSGTADAGTGTQNGGREVAGSTRVV